MKKIKFWMGILCFLLSFIAHNFYDFFPCFITSIFFPVNESVFEHMKIIFTCILLSSAVEYCVYKCKGIKPNNFTLSIPITAILGIIIYLLLYYLIELIIPHSLYVTIALLLLVFLICEKISLYIQSKEKIKKEKMLGIILIVICYLLFTLFTYKTPKYPIFYDNNSNIYGICKEKNCQ